MRFLADGPSIPDELLLARDEGRVVFFCGAGVSRARAELPDFFGLVELVMEHLKTTPNSRAERLLSFVRSARLDDDLGSITSADRVFGFLEAEFGMPEVRRAVARALKPVEEVDLSAHRILIDLSTGPGRVTRLVTTNFDRLFQAAAPALPTFRPPLFPDLSKPEAFAGLVHLHGILDVAHVDAEGNELVLSSADFGRAYLLDGWATSFIRRLLEQFQLVFVGYSADDPPVQYLLEAIGRTGTRNSGLYAFHAGRPDQAQAQWERKGIRPIPYDEADRHRALWQTLEAWAERARDPSAWSKGVIGRARKGPEVLLPHERGQVAHVVSTADGAKLFVGTGDPPPAEWLCVFDPAVRFAKPGQLRSSWLEQGPMFDPFAAYGLDDDPIPPLIDGEDPWSSREIPASAWDAFRETVRDASARSGPARLSLRGPTSTGPTRLPPRLWQLARWISGVSTQPAALWWAAGQRGLHEDALSMLRHHLRSDGSNIPTAVAKGWRLIFEAFGGNKGDTWYEVTRQVRAEGWSGSALRELAAALKPRLKVERPSFIGPRPPQPAPEPTLVTLLRTDVAYEDRLRDLTIPNEHLAAGVRMMRSLIEDAIALEIEVGGYGLRISRPLTPDSDLDNDGFREAWGLYGLVTHYARLYERLVAFNIEAARREKLAWPEEDHVFARLRIWTVGKPAVTSADEAARCLLTLSDEAFWNPYHQRDLLLGLKARWNELPKRLRSRLVARMERGRKKYEVESRREFITERAHGSLDRLGWLASQGCDLGPNIEILMGRLCRRAPDWRPEFAEGAASSYEPRGGWVRTDADPSPLLSVPLSKIVTMAQRLKGRSSTDWLLEMEPFQGLVATKPVRAVGALWSLARRGEYPAWAWQQMLDHDDRKNDPSRFTQLIAGRVAALPPVTLANLIQSACNWLGLSGSHLARMSPSLFDKVWGSLTAALKAIPDAGRSAIIRTSGERDWVTDAINAPSGKLTKFLYELPDVKGLKVGDGLPTAWCAKAEQLLGLEGEAGQYAMVIFARVLGRLYAIDPAWTESNLLPKAGPRLEDGPFIAGLLHGGLSRQELLIRLKPFLLDLVPMLAGSRQSASHLAGRLLAGWASRRPNQGERCVADDELRSALLAGDDAFRRQALGHLESWVRSGEDPWTPATVAEFLAEVWPRQLEANSASVSAQMCDVLFQLGDLFPSTLDAVLPRLTSLMEDAAAQREGIDEPEEILLERFPDAVLSLLDMLLKGDPLRWPYWIDQALEKLVELHPKFGADGRLLTLKRRRETS